MKIISFVFSLAILCIGVSAFAQHGLQLDQSGSYSLLKGSSSGGVYTLNNGGGTILTTGNSLSNTGDNPIAGDNQGLGSNGLSWKISFNGFAATFINEDNTSGNRDGVQIALANNDGASRALVVTTGTNFNPTGGNGTRNEVFRVMNDGSVTSSTTVTANDVKTGGGTYFASSSAENLKIIRGIFDKNANIVSGSGFTVAKIGAGDFQVNFTSGFSDYPSIAFSTSGDPDFVVWHTLGSTSTEINVKNTAGTLVDPNIYVTFIAIGAR